MDDSRAFVRNSLANLAGGMSMAVLSLLVPPILSRYLPQAQFRVWMLLIQLATFSGLLNLGLQSAISRYVAHYLAANDRDSASNLVSTAFLMLAISALAATTAVFALSSNLAGLFPALPEQLADTAKTGLLVMGITSALGIPIEAISGTIVGIQRNDAAAAIQGTGRLTLAAALVTIVLMRGGITAMATAFAISNVAAYIGLWLVYRHFDVVDISYRRMSRESLRQIWDYSGTVAVWMIAMFFINGFDVALVGRLDFPAVGVYSACFGPILVIAGTQHALFSPLLQFGAVRSSRGSKDALPPLLLRTTRLSTLVLMLMSVPLLLFSRNLLAWWLGPTYSDQTLAIFRLLLVGNTTRLLGTPYAMLLMATLRHRQVLLSPILEAATNVLIAVVAGLRFGAVGVACGVVTGALIGQLMFVFVNAPRTVEVIGNLRRLLSRGIATPIACALPGLAAAALPVDLLSRSTRMSFDAIALIACAALAWRFCLEVEEKHFLESLWARTGTAPWRARNDHD